MLVDQCTQRLVLYRAARGDDQIARDQVALDVAADLGEIQAPDRARRAHDGQREGVIAEVGAVDQVAHQIFG